MSFKKCLFCILQKSCPKKFPCLMPYSFCPRYFKKKIGFSIKEEYLHKPRRFYKIFQKTKFFSLFHYSYAGLNNWKDIPFWGKILIILVIFLILIEKEKEIKKKEKRKLKEKGKRFLWE